MLLLSHEMCHDWIPGRIQIEATDKDIWWHWAWFEEGIDDYYSRRMLLDDGLLSRDRFVYLVNRDIRNIADNPHRDIGDQESTVASGKGLFNTSYVKLSYYRGALMASNWDAEARRNSNGKRTIEDVLRAVYREARANGGRLTSARFFDIVSQFGISAENERQSFVLKGQAIPPDSLEFGPNYQLRQTLVPKFDPGFDVSASLRGHRVISVAPGGTAERAGLKDGMKLLDIQNSNRFSNAFRLDEPMKVVVDDGGARRAYSYLPYGRAAALPQYRKVPKTNH